MAELAVAFAMQRSPRMDAKNPGPLIPAGLIIGGLILLPVIAIIIGFDLVPLMAITAGSRTAWVTALVVLVVLAVAAAVVLRSRNRV
jgi:hypothetical protein